MTDAQAMKTDPEFAKSDSDPRFETDNPLPRQLLIDANINPDTYLATDYLNHFNEIIMLLEMLPDMPEVTEDICEWEPKSYPEHFERSSFTEKALAIEAYRRSPPIVRRDFDLVIQEIDEYLLDLQTMVAGINPAQPIDPALHEEMMSTLLTRIHPAKDRANGIIHGNTWALDDIEHAEIEKTRSTIDELFG
jgi:hypothetical protein